MKRRFLLIGLLTLVVVSLGFLFQTTTGQAQPAGGDKDKVSRMLFAQFIDNLEEDRFAFEGSPSIMMGSLSHPFAVTAGTAAMGVGFASGAAMACSVISDTDFEFRQCFLEFSGAFGEKIEGFPGDIVSEFQEGLVLRVDPQMAILFQSFEVEGRDILDELIEEATLRENVVFKKHLPNFLGGATFIGSSAFGGELLDSEGNPVPDIDLRFGVFIKDDGTTLFTPIIFSRQSIDLLRVELVEWNLEPVFREGTFTAQVQRLVAIDPVEPVE